MEGGRDARALDITDSAVASAMVATEAGSGSTPPSPAPKRFKKSDEDDDPDVIDLSSSTIEGKRMNRYTTADLATFEL
jgi:hypothetical protein